MHYTSVENIHKVIDPLFLDHLKNELKEIQQITVQKTKNKKAKTSRQSYKYLRWLRIGKWKFPYRDIYQYSENEAIKELQRGQNLFLALMNLPRFMFLLISFMELRLMILLLQLPRLHCGLQNPDDERDRRYRSYEFGFSAVRRQMRLLWKEILCKLTGKVLYQNIRFPILWEILRLWC